MGIIGSFFNMLHELFTGDWPGIVLGVIIVLGVLVVIGFIAWGVFYAFDSWFLPQRQEPGIITGRGHSSAHYQPVINTMSDGNGGVSTYTTMIYIPESWSVSVRVGKRAGSMGCSEDYYDKAKQDQKVTVHYVSGRFSDHMYVKTLS